jgi:Ca-activated chloride channel homolog
MSTWIQRLIQVFWSDVSFATPGLLWAAVCSPLFVLKLHIWDHFRRNALTSRLGELPVIRRVIASASPGRRVVKDVLVAIGLMLVFFAAARPQLEGERRVEIRGLDVALAVDVSKSMLVEDVGPPTKAMTADGKESNRLNRARELAVQLIDALPGDRIAPLVFAGGAAHYPITEDQQAAARFLQDLGPNDLPAGSNLAELFRVARCELRPDAYDDLKCSKLDSNRGRRGHGGDALRGESLDPRGERGGGEEKLEQEIERGRALVVLTDGGDVDTETLREVAVERELGIAVILVGLGSAKGDIVYEVDPISGKRTSTPKHDENGATVVSRRDDTGMKAIAEAGGDENRYIVADEQGELDATTLKIVDTLRAVDRGLATKKIKLMRDIFQPFLFIGLILLIIEPAIGTRRHLRYPEAR